TINLSSPAVVNGVVYIGSLDGKLYAVDAASGARLWTATTGRAITSSPTVAGNGFAYAGSTDDKLYAFSAAGSTGCSGTARTCPPLCTSTSASGITGSSPAVVNGVVYIGSFDFKLYAFDATGSSGCSGTPKTCTPLWTATTGGSIYSSPAVA